MIASLNRVTHLRINSSYAVLEPRELEAHMKAWGDIPVKFPEMISQRVMFWILIRLDSPSDVGAYPYKFQILLLSLACSQSDIEVSFFMQLHDNHAK